MLLKPFLLYLRIKINLFCGSCQLSAESITLWVFVKLDVFKLTLNVKDKEKLILILSFGLGFAKSVKRH
jgi:hypothetical protein